MITRRVPPWLVAWAPVVAWMAVIFLLSGQPSEDSSALSGSVLHVIATSLDAAVRFLGGAGLSAEAVGVLHVVVRKTAHVVAYLVLGALAARALGVGGERASPRAALIAWLLAAAYAATDEVHQLLVPGRGGQVTDVLLDSAGAALGVWLYGRWLAGRPTPSDSPAPAPGPPAMPDR